MCWNHRVVKKYKMERRIKRNIVKCNKCGDTVESVYTHDFKWCKCGSIAVDGGRSYLKRCGDLANYLDLSEYEGDENDCIE